MSSKFWSWFLDILFGYKPLSIKEYCGPPEELSSMAANNSNFETARLKPKKSTSILFFSKSKGVLFGHLFNRGWLDDIIFLKSFELVILEHETV